METTTTTDKKREFINISVTSEEKKAITKAAITDCGISVSEYCRTKVLTPKKEITESEIEVFTNEEKEVYEAKIMEQTETINKLNAELVRVKVSGSTPTPGIDTLNADQKDFVIPLSSVQSEFLENVIKIEADSFFGTDYKNFKNFICKKIGDLITSNSDDANEIYKEGTPERAEVSKFMKYLKDIVSENEQ